MAFALPAKLAARLRGLADVPVRAAPAVAARLRGFVPAPPRGDVVVTASGSEVTITQTRPHGPPVASVLPADGLPPTWRAAIEAETGKAFAEAMGGK